MWYTTTVYNCITHNTLFATPTIVLGERFRSGSSGFPSRIQQVPLADSVEDKESDPYEASEEKESPGGGGNSPAAHSGDVADVTAPAVGGGDVNIVEKKQPTVLGGAGACNKWPIGVQATKKRKQHRQGEGGRGCAESDKERSAIPSPTKSISRLPTRLDSVESIRAWPVPFYQKRLELDTCKTLLGAGLNLFGAEIKVITMHLMRKPGLASNRSPSPTDR